MPDDASPRPLQNEFPYHREREPHSSKVPMKVTHIGLTLLVLLFTATSGWSEAEPESRERFVCNFAGHQRFIDIYRLAASGPRGGGCRVDYTKDGVTKRLWSATTDYPYCVKRALALVTTLSKGNFACRPETTDSRNGTGTE
jgi:hypothetical protein